MQETIDDQVSVRLKTEREKIAVDEARKVGFRLDLISTRKPRRLPNSRESSKSATVNWPRPRMPRPNSYASSVN